MSVNRSASLSFPRRDITVPILAAAMSQPYVAGLIAPVFYTPGESGKVPRLAYEVFRTMPEKSLVRGKGAGYPQSNIALGDFEYATKDRGLEIPIDDTDRANYGDLYNLEMACSQAIWNQMMIRREYDFFAQLYNESTWTASGTTGATLGTPWSTSASADPIGNIETGIQGIIARGGSVANVHLVCNRKQYSAICRTAQVLDRLKYTGRPNALLPIPEVADLLGVKGIIVGQATRNTGKPGGTVTPGYIQSDTYAALVEINASQDVIEPCSFRQMVWNEDGGEMTVEQYRDEPIRADKLRIRNYTDDTTVETSCTYLFKTVL